MPYLKLSDRTSGDLVEFEQDQVRIGRAPDCEIVPSGAGSEVVSGYHLRLFDKDGAWHLEDLGSRNGTFIDDVPARAHVPAPAKLGQTIRLGERGPAFRIEALTDVPYEETIEESRPLIDPDEATLPMSAYGATEEWDASRMPQPPPPPESHPPPPASSAPHIGPPTAAPESPPPKPEPVEATPVQAEPEPVADPVPVAKEIRIVVVESRSSERWEATGGRIRVGRGKECELRPIGPSDTSVSRVHAEILLKPDGRVVIRDAHSRNGTLLNGEPVLGDVELNAGDYVQLGDQGPNLSVDVLEVPGPEQPVPSDTPEAPPPKASAAAAKKVDRVLEGMGAPRRSFGGKGATVFFKEMFHDTERKSAHRVRVVVWSAVVVLVVAVGGIYWWSERRVRETAVTLEQQQRAAIAAIADSISASANSEYDRLRQEFQEASAGSAPSAVVESLRVALETAQERTASLEAAVRRAQSSMAEQLVAGDSVQRAAQAELERLRSELTRASGTQMPSVLLDSLQRALSDAEQRSARISSQLDAVREVDLAAVAQANQGAIGLVTAFVGTGIFDGTGFVLTRSGYMVTNRHVVQRDDVTADSVYVTMADQQRPLRGHVVMVAPYNAPDLAMVRIEDYGGPHVIDVDWSGSKVRQGAPAALIGFPAGLGNALDATQTVRTLMAAGIFSRVTNDVINFDGFTTGGSSGSPIFNAMGEVVAVHRAGLAEATGLSFAVPITLLIPLMPQTARDELGIQ